MASSSNPVDINNANLAELKSIPNIGEKRAGAIAKLREERGSLSLEDLKTMSTVPNTIWDPLVSEGVIVFRERVKQQEKTHLNVEDLSSQVSKLQAEILRQAKDIERRDIQIAQSEKDITARQKQLDSLEKTLTLEHEERLNKLQQKFQTELENTKSHYEKTISKTMTVKDDELALMKQRLVDQDSKWINKMQQLENKLKQLEDEKINREVDKLAPHGVYWKSSTNPTGCADTLQSKGPSPPKMSTFDGKNDWKPFFTQFNHISSRYKWSEEQKLDKLIECLRDKALKYFSSRPISDQKSLKKLSVKLDERFGKKDLPHIIRRQLQDVKQGSEETVEEFADKVLEMTTDGYPDTPEDCRQTVGIDAFLRGCYNKQAALIAMDKNPLTLDMATQYMKTAVTNQKLILDVRKSETRRVKFESSESESLSDMFIPEELAKEQDKDYDLYKIKTWLESGIKPSQKELSLSSPSVRYLWACESQLQIIDKRNRETVVHHDRIKLCQDLDYPGWVKRIRNKIFDENDKESKTSEESLNAALESEDKVSDIINLFNARDDASDILMHHQSASSDSNSADRTNQDITRGKRTRQRPKYLADFVQD
nr:uncharacterized protein LOC105339112 [Crassostrea gigas]